MRRPVFILTALQKTVKRGRIICMKFVITPAIISDVLEHMRDFSGHWMFDLFTLTCVSVSPESQEDAIHHVALPVWNETDGYRAMRDFSKSVTDDFQRSELFHALSGSEGVYREFKNVLRKNHSLEKSYESFLKNAMETEIRAWFAELGESVNPRKAESEVVGDLAKCEYTVERMDWLTVDLPAKDIIASTVPVWYGLFRDLIYEETKLFVERGGAEIIGAVNPVGCVDAICVWKSEGKGAIVKLIGSVPSRQGLGLEMLLLEFVSAACKRKDVRSILVVNGDRESVHLGNIESLSETLILRL